MRTECGLSQGDIEKPPRRCLNGGVSNKLESKNSRVCLGRLGLLVQFRAFIRS